VTLFEVEFFIMFPSDDKVPAPDAPLGMDYDYAVYQTLLESTKAIPWKIDWATMRFTYIGPQIEPLLGWERDSWVSAEDWAARIHPEERDHIVNFCISQSQAGADHEADYRALTKDDGYVWIRDVVHVVRNEQGEVESLVGFMFDISERKKKEQELLDLQKELETLSFEDGLTGISNRRMFDLHLERLWEQARANGRPLSLILADIDHFKPYNDRYGHLRGDECLREIAHALRLVGDRPDDVVARFGGEEFVLLLPDTPATEARSRAELCQRLIAELGIEHEAGVCPLVTASFGVGSILPTGDAASTDFLQAVDALLYAAKQKGRNRIEAMDA
jgi:diguanylate cyclase (GGDEF)-like protein/PAS domain S-box-containing protein